MAHYTSVLSFVLVLGLFSLVNIEARESKFFTKAVVLQANNQTKNVTHHVDPPSPSPSPSPAPVESEIKSGYGLYGRDEVPSTSDSLFENKIPTQEFDEKFGKDEFDNNDLPTNYNEHSYVTVPQGDNKDKFDNEEFGNNHRLPNNYNERSYVTVPQDDNKEKFEELPSNYNEHSYVTVPQGDKFDNEEEFSNNRLPSNYNEHSYVTVPQGTNLYDTKFTPTAEEKLTPEEEKLFDDNQRYDNSYVNFNGPHKFSETPKFANYFNDNHNTYNSVKEPQGMSDTRTLENGKYHYALNEDGRQSGHVKGQGYYGKNSEPKSKYEFDTMEEFERQEVYSQIPGEYINP